MSARHAVPVALVAALAAAAPAHAVDKVKPAPCASIYLDDAPGDQLIEQDPFGVGPKPIPSKKGPDEADITNVFFNYREGSDGKKVLTANIQVTKLSLTIPSKQDSTGGLAWYVHFNHGDAIRFVRAHNQLGTGVTYAYGTVDPDTGVYLTDGQTKGAFFEGPGGVVQIDVPEELGGKAGEELGGAIAVADGFQAGPDDRSGINNHFDTAPNDASESEPSGPGYTVADCPAGSPRTAPGPAVPATPAASTPDAPASGGGGGSTTAPPASGGGASQAPARPLLTFQRVLKAAKKGKRLALTVSPSQPVTSLKLQLRDAKSKVVARGGLKRLKKAGKVRIKLRKALKPGRYTIVATAKAGGRTQRVTQAVFVKR